MTHNEQTKIEMYNITAKQLPQLGKLLSIMYEIKFDPDQYTQFGYNQNSGFVYVWDEMKTYSIAIDEQHRVKFVMFIDPENRETKCGEYIFSFDEIKDLTQRGFPIDEDIEKYFQQLRDKHETDTTTETEKASFTEF